MLKCCLGTKIKNCQRGAVIVLFALLLPVLFGFMGLGIDVGLAYVEKGKVQDIADSAALAGAAKLSADGHNDMDAIKTAVESYVKANGISLGENDMLRKDADKWDDKETLAAGQDALVAYGVVTFADGETPDRVRVRITKRIPSFFVNVLGDFSDGFTVVAKAAAEGEKKEEIVKVSGAGLISYGGTMNLYTSQVFGRHDNNGKGIDSDIIASGYIQIKDEKLQMEADIYAKNISGDVNFKKGAGFKDISGQQVKLDEVNNLVTKCDTSLTNAVSNVESFKSGVDGKKLFLDSSGFKPSAPTTGDGKEYDIYIDASLMTYNKNNQYRFINALNNITVNNIYVDAGTSSGVILNTEGLKCNNVFINGNAFIEGKDNLFNGVIYSSGVLNVLGDRNEYSQLLGKNLNVGYGFGGANEPSPTDGKWKWYLNAPPPAGESGSGSGGSGSGSGGSTTIGKLRLVE